MNPKKIMKNSLLLFAGLLIGVTQKTRIYAMDENIELLVVIDGSSSMSEEGDDIRQLIKTFCQWIEEEPHIQNADYIIFRGEASEACYDEVMDMTPRGYTNITAGLELADKKVQEAIENGQKLSVLVISDMLTSREGGYTWEDAQNEQKAINDFFESWNDYSANGQMSYLVLTWKDDEYKSLHQIQSEHEEQSIPYPDIVKEFCCTVPNDERVCWIKEEVSEEKKSALSQAQLLGYMMKNILEMLNGLETNQLDPAFSDKNGTLGLKAFYEAYVVINENDSLCQIDGEKVIEITKCQSLGDIKIYHLEMDFNGSNYRILSDNPKPSDCCVFYMPRPQISAYIVPLRPEAGSELQLKCEIKEKDILDLLPKPFEAVIYRKGAEGEELIDTMKMQEEPEGVFSAKTSLEEGEYVFRVKTADGQMLGETEESVRKESKRNPDSTPEPEEPGESNFAVICCVAMVAIILLAMSVIYVQRKRRK